MNYVMKKKDPLDGNYLASPFHNQVFRPPKFYAEWKERLKKKRAKAAQIAKDLAQDIDMIKRYLDDEDKFIKDDIAIQEKITKDEIDKIDEEHAKKFKEEEEPLKKKNDDLQNTVKNIKDLKERGKEGEEKINLLDDLPGPKTGIRIEFNNIFNVATDNPLKIEFSVYMGKEKIFDEFGNPADYLLPLVDAHVDYEKLVMNKGKKKKKKRKRIDVEVDEVWYIVKDFRGLLKLFEYETNIWLLFKFFEIIGESKLRDPQGFKGTDWRVKE